MRPFSVYAFLMFGTLYALYCYWQKPLLVKKGRAEEKIRDKNFQSFRAEGQSLSDAINQAVESEAYSLEELRILQARVQVFNQIIRDTMTSDVRGFHYFIHHYHLDSRIAAKENLLRRDG